MMYMELIDHEICREYAATTAEKESLEAKDKFLHRKKVGAVKMIMRDASKKTPKQFI